MLYNFDTSRDDRARAALLIYALFKSRDAASPLNGLETWSRAESYCKAACLKSSTTAEFTTRFKELAKIPSIKPYYLTDGEGLVQMPDGTIIQTDGLPSYMYRYKGRDYYRMCPLADWTTDDVGAYIVTHAIPTLRWYQDFGFDSRTTARLTGDAVRQNTLVWVKKNNPAGYARLLERFPEFGQYV